MFLFFSILAADMGGNQSAIAIHLHLQPNLNQLAIAIHLQPTCNPLAIAIHQQSTGNCDPLEIAIHWQSIANCNTLAIHWQLQSTCNPLAMANRLAGQRQRQIKCSTQCARTHNAHCYELIDRCQWHVSCQQFSPMLQMRCMVASTRKLQRCVRCNMWHAAGAVRMQYFAVVHVYLLAST